MLHFSKKKKKRGATQTLIFFLLLNLLKHTKIFYKQTKKTELLQYNKSQQTIRFAKTLHIQTFQLTLSK